MLHRPRATRAILYSETQPLNAGSHGINGIYIVRKTYLFFVGSWGYPGNLHDNK